MRKLIFVLCLSSLNIVQSQKDINPIPIKDTDLMISAIASSTQKMKFKIYAANTSDNKPQVDNIEVYPFTETTFRERILKALLKKKDTNTIESIALALINSSNSEKFEEVVDQVKEKKKLLRFLVETIPDSISKKLLKINPINSEEEIKSVFGQKGSILDSSLENLDSEKGLIKLLETLGNKESESILKNINNHIEVRTLYFHSYLNNNFVSKNQEINNKKLLSQKANSDYIIELFKPIYLHFYNISNVLFEYDNEPLAGTISYDTIFNIVYNSPGINEIFLRKKARKIFRDSINEVRKERKKRPDEIKNYEYKIEEIIAFNGNLSKRFELSDKQLRYLNSRTKQKIINSLDTLIKKTAKDSLSNLIGIQNIRNELNVLKDSIKNKNENSFMEALYFNKIFLEDSLKQMSAQKIIFDSKPSSKLKKLKVLIENLYNYKSQRKNLFVDSELIDDFIKIQKVEEGRGYIVQKLIQKYLQQRQPKHLDSVVENIGQIIKYKNEITKIKEEAKVRKNRQKLQNLYYNYYGEIPSNQLIEKLQDENIFSESKLDSIKSKFDDERQITQALLILIKDELYGESYEYDDWELVSSDEEILRYSRKIDSLEKVVTSKLKKSPKFQFVAKNIKLTFDDGFIENVQVSGKIKSTYIPNDYNEQNKKILNQFLVEKQYLSDSLSKELKFENSYPIGFSSETDFQDLSNYELHHFDKTNGTYKLKLRDVIKNYFQELGNDRLDYSPKNQVVELRDSDPNKTMRVPLKKQISSKLFSLDVFSDFIGFNNEKPNGILQLEVNKDIPLNTRRYLIRPFRGKLDRSLNIGTFNLINFALNWRRIESNESKDIALNYIDRFENNQYSPITYINQLDLIRNENLSVGFDVNFFSLDMPSWKLKWEINTGGRFGRTRILDNERAYDNGVFTENSNPSSTQLNTWRLYPELKIKIRPEERYGAFLSWKPTFFNTTADFADVSNEEAFLATGIDEFQWLHRIELSTHFTPSAESDNRFFFRYRYTNSFDWQGNGFHEVQVGYSAYLKF